MDKELVEKVAEELLKIPKGYVGITDPITPLERERRLKRTRAQAEVIIPIITASIKEAVEGVLDDEWREVNLAHSLEDTVRGASGEHYLYYKREAQAIIRKFKQAVLNKIDEVGK